MSEKYLWKNAKARGIKTLAFLDQWQNYALRFSGPSPKEKLTYLPDRINCINETGREEMLAEGFPKELLVPLGQPYLSELKTTAEVLDPSVIRRKWGIPSGRPVVLFVSEPIEDSFAHTRGYSEYSVLDFFISTLWPTVKNGFLVLKLHDKDDPKKYTSSFTRLKPNVLVLGREATPVETIVAADHVYGMTSIMLIQSFILGKNTVSLQPGLISNDPLVLSRKGYIRLVRSKKDIDVPWKPSNPDSFEFAFRKAEFMKMIAALM